METWLEFVLGIPMEIAFQFLTLPPAYTSIPTRPPTSLHTQTGSGPMENPYGSQPLVGQPSPSGKSGSPQMPYPRRSRPSLFQGSVSVATSSKNLRNKFSSSPLYADSPLCPRAKLWCGMLRTPNPCYIARMPRSIQGCPSPPTVVSSHARLPEQMFVYGRSPPPVIHSTKHSHPAPHVPGHSSPQMESRLSCLVAPRSGYGTQKILPPPFQYFNPNPTRRKFRRGFFS